jgi:hypothetical protein
MPSNDLEGCHGLANIVNRFAWFCAHRDGNRAMSSRGVWCLCAAICLLASQSACRRQPERTVLRPETGYAFPEASQIASFAVDVPTLEGTERPAFNAPQGSWSAILGCLTPSEFDPYPAAWQVMGSVTIRTRGKNEIVLGLFDTEEPIGAFCIGADGERRRYYRGGNSALLRNAIADAYAQIRPKKAGAGRSQ